MEVSGAILSTLVPLPLKYARTLPAQQLLHRAGGHVSPNRYKQTRGYFESLLVGCSTWQLAG